MAGHFTSVTTSMRLLGTRVSKPGRNVSLQLPSNALLVVTISASADGLFPYYNSVVVSIF